MTRGNRADVVIVGGGFVGMAAAAALSDGRRRIVVLEARAGADPRFRGELIHPPGVEVLRGLGLLEPLIQAGGVPVAGFAVVLDEDRPSRVLRYEEVPHGAPRGLAIAHQDMVAALRREVVKRPGVEFHAGQRVEGLLHDEGRIAGVYTAQGTEVPADLTIVAEGRHSKLRRALGFAEETQLLSFTAALRLEGARLPYPSYGHVFLGTWGPILAYHIGDPGVRMCIDLPVTTGKGHEAVQRFLTAECAPSVPEPLRGALLRAIRKEPLEICANHAIYTQRCTAPGVALVGDSGGCSHPLTATGMTIGLNDIRVLADELDEGGPTDAALTRYQRRRYAFVRAREILAQGMYDVFRGGDAGAKALRSGLFRYWGGSPRARATSLALLSGHDSRLIVFVSEYLNVVGQSAASVLGGASDTPGLRGRAATLRGLVRTAYTEFDRTVSMVYKDVKARRTPQPIVLSAATRGARASLSPATAAGPETRFET
jgi:squalene monooxygenase